MKFIVVLTLVETILKFLEVSIVRKTWHFND